MKKIRSKKEALGCSQHYTSFFSDVQGQITLVLVVVSVTKWTKQAFSCSKFLSPGGQLWANTAFEGSQFYSIGIPKFYSWVNVISVYAYNDLG